MAVSKEERDYLKKRVKALGRTGTIVEIGSWIGQSSVAISKGIRKYWPETVFYCVDIFSQEYYEASPGLRDMARKINILETFEANMRKFPHKTMKMKSVDAAIEFMDESIDLIFIDANHEYEFVKEDINAWWPKLKKGGIMCGHDYSAKFGGVMMAVKERFPVFTNPVRTIWEVVK